MYTSDRGDFRARLGVDGDGDGGGRDSTDRGGEFGGVMRIFRVSGLGLGSLGLALLRRRWHFNVFFPSSASPVWVTEPVMGVGWWYC